MCFIIYVGPYAEVLFFTALYYFNFRQGNIRVRICLNVFCPVFLHKTAHKKVSFTYYMGPIDPNKTLLPCQSNSSWSKKLINYINRKRRFQTFFTSWSEPPILFRLHTASVRNFIWGLSDPLMCLRVNNIFQGEWNRRRTPVTVPLLASDYSVYVNSRSE